VGHEFQTLTGIFISQPVTLTTYLL
jgi:hypothetical protein